MSSSILLAYAAALSAFGLAVVWLLFKHRTPAHWSFAGGLVLLAADTALAGLEAGAASGVEVFKWDAWRAGCAALLPATWLLYSLCYSRGNYREFLVRWRSGIAATLLVSVVLAALTVNAERAALQNPADPAEDWTRFIPLGWPGKALQITVLLGLLLALVNLEKTLRSALGLMRWRVKFVILGLAVILGGRIFASSQAILFSGIQPWLVSVLAASLLVGTLVIGFSVARAGWQEIEVYPSPTFLHGSLSVMLAGAYLLVVGLVAEMVTRWGGDRAFPFQTLFLILAAVPLGALFLSDRFRQQTQLFVSRHLRRPLHDYRRVWTTFTEHTASRLDRVEYCRAVVLLTSETFNTLSVTIWVLDPSQSRWQLGASTSLTEETAGSLTTDDVSASGLLAALEANPHPFGLETSQAAWVQALRRGNPDHFHKGGGQVCAPLLAAGQVLGCLLLADRVGGRGFTPEDFELLKCVADQVAAGLLNLKLSGKLIEAKELEAFQAMSAFFVHDLKNTASTLSMMLQNLPVHFNNPDFRADALRGIGKSVDRLNGLVERLKLIRHGFAVRPWMMDLNALVTATVAEFRQNSGLPVECVLDSLPQVPVDPEQFPKILTNLLLNAAEATGEQGRIRVTTTERNQLVVVSVADNGTGMSPDFVNRRLFRPFQTTKKKGLGIGLFQSRTIAEAHGGRIEVESEVGRGTTFRVLLPMTARNPGSSPAWTRSELPAAGGDVRKACSSEAKAVNC